MIIVIEGGDQAGKLTQSILLEKSLKTRKIKTKLFHFPDYDTPIGKEIRKFLYNESTHKRTYDLVTLFIDKIVSTKKMMKQE